MKWRTRVLLYVAVVVAMNEIIAAQPNSPLIGGRSSLHTNSSQPLPESFDLALEKSKTKSGIVVLFPTELPLTVSRAKFATIEKLSTGEYAIALYYALNRGNSGFAASFAGSAHPNYEPKSLPNVQEVKLCKGLIGYFRPINCGGSCTPANLWWEQNHVLYHIELKLPSTSSERTQLKTLTEVANSAILAGPR